METVIEMAGDWIKFETATLEKPEVCQIADAADIDLDAAVGKLLRVWVWFDQQSEDGNAPSVSKKLLDRLVGVTGFCDLMESVGWMTNADGVITLPNFERHNGKTAKNRALTAKRVANHKVKSNAEANDAGVSDALPREEKRREEKEQEQKTMSDAFAVFWKLYPKKVSKADAVKAWGKIKKDMLPTIMKSLSVHLVCEQWVKDDGQFVPNAATWLNKKKWEDEVKPYVEGTNGQRSGASRPSLVDQVRQRGREIEAERHGQAGHGSPPDGELPPAWLGEGRTDWEGEFTRINDADGSLVGIDD